ncbi:DNA breaking-rejoining enzyme [Lactarius deliciosus]|nr:DNA breaking-rejoining enzyme [Lactarius deliciosus]
MWIMNECDELNLDGKKRLSTQVRTTYGTMQKMRASMTYAFGRIHGLGSMHWQRGSDGRMVGNPSVSEVVSWYMLSLHRCKVQARETATSARTISAATMYDLYHFNSRVPVRDLRHPPAKKSKADCNQWAGQNSGYSSSHSAVLKIQSHDFIHLGNNRLQLTLPFQKTNQFGHIKPFVLHKLPEPMAHLCPVRAYAEWIDASQIEHGYMFRKLGSRDRISENNQPMWLASNLRWPLWWICEWGGWSMEFMHLMIIKYLISWNDDPLQNREDFFNLNQAPALKCFACGWLCCCS